MAKHFRILVVEDHNDSPEMLEEFLTEEGFTVETRGQRAAGAGAAGTAPGRIWCCWI